MQPGNKGGGVGKHARMEGTRVTKTHGETPMAGHPQKKDATMKGGRVSKSPGLSRRGDPKGRSAGSLGLKVGNRVTRGGGK